MNSGGARIGIRWKGDKIEWNQDDGKPHTIKSARGKIEKSSERTHENHKHISFVGTDSHDKFVASLEIEP